MTAAHSASATRATAAHSTANRSAGIGLGELGTRRQRHQVRIDAVTLDRPHVLDGHTVDRAHLGDQEIDEAGVGEPDDQLVDDPSATRFEDLDAEHVAAHRTDPARDLTQRAGTVGQPDAQDDGVHHAEATGALCREREPLARSAPPSARVW